ncbi:MAG: acyltransferase [Candidatus Microthrix sp.]|jgi:peptidoglycan/LPS O-acetylase OafA/YrhL|nr:acyltransferase [Candidatus Microthrix sp.]
MTTPPLKSREQLGEAGGGDAQSPSRLPYIQAIDGLRALAVVAVVLNHIDFPGMSSGFVGVDIFFAISGFLITRQIVTKQAAGSPQQLREFWAGRARRIVPAMVLVIAVTCLGSVMFLAPQELERVGFYGFASDLFGMNIAAATRGGNYFDGPLRESPFLHLWSLGVEEQFYLVWPLVLGPFAVVAMKRLRWSRQRTLAVALALLGLGSLLASVVQTTSSPLWAFYGLHTRLYEFIIGGSAALFWQWSLDRRTGRLFTIGGLAMIVAAFVWTPVDVGFPGAWPLLAVIGSVAMILGFTHGPREQGFSVPGIFSWSPARRIGRYSYSWYLWHWPAFVLALAATNGNKTIARIACVAAIVPAAASFHFVEQRVRLAPSLVKSSTRSLAFGAAALGFGAACSIGVVVWGRIGVSDPQVAEWVQAEESYRPDGCEQNSTLLGADVCLGGSDEPGAPVVLLIGDSHAAQWVGAFSDAGRLNGFAVALRNYGNCPAAPLGPSAAEKSADDQSCALFQNETVGLLSNDQISAVVMTDAGSSRRKFDDVAAWSRSALGLAEFISDANVPLGLLVDNPNSGDPLQCLSRDFSMAECAIPKDEALVDLRSYSAAEIQLVEDANVDRLDLTAITCPGDPCPIRVGGTWVAARGNHLTRAFTKLQADRIGNWVDELLRKR